MTNTRVPEPPCPEDLIAFARKLIRKEEKRNELIKLAAWLITTFIALVGAIPAVFGDGLSLPHGAAVAWPTPESLPKGWQRIEGGQLPLSHYCWIVKE